MTGQIPIWTLARSREEFAGDRQVPILTVKSDSGVSVRDFSDGGRAVSEDLSDYRVVRAGDLVVNKMWARFGAYGVASDVGAISPAYWVLKLDEEMVVPRFLHHLLRSTPYLAEIRRLSKDLPPNGYDLPWHLFRSIRVDLPPLTEQRAIADYLDTETARIDALITKKRRMIGLVNARFRAQIDTEFGSTPAEEPRLGRFVRGLTQGDSPQASSEPYADGERGLLKLSAVRFGRYRPTENKALPPDYDARNAIVPAVGDLLVTRSNTPEYVGDACAVVDADPSVVLCDLIYRVQLDERLMAEYAAYALISGRGRAALAGSARGTSQSMVKLRGEDIRAVPVPYCDLPEQHRVVARLNELRAHASDIEAKLQEQTDLLVEHRQALITAAVTGEFRVPGAA